MTLAALREAVTTLRDTARDIAGDLPYTSACIATGQLAAYDRVLCLLDEHEAREQAARAEMAAIRAALSEPAGDAAPPSPVGEPT